MILPNKHIHPRHSILGIGGEILANLENRETISRLWEKCRNISEVRSFERFTVALDFLFAIGFIDFKDGYLEKVDIQ
jgi:hypothetical protein